MVGNASAMLVTHQMKSREITNAGPLDADSFWPHADVIGGSRWPGTNGGPKKDCPDGSVHNQGNDLA